MIVIIGLLIFVISHCTKTNNEFKSSCPVNGTRLVDQCENSIYQDKSSILILNTYYRRNKPILAGLINKRMRCPIFTIDDGVGVSRSCGVTYQNQFFVYGGKTETRQIAKVIQKSLKNVGTLPFDFFNGGCSSTSNRIILCFCYYGDYRSCYQSMNPTTHFVGTRKSNYGHKSIKVASSERKFIIKTIGTVISDSNNQTEYANLIEHKPNP